MLHELDQPGFIKVIEETLDIGVKHVVHLLLQKRIRQRIQRIMLAAPRAKAVGEAEKVLLVNLMEDGDHSLLDYFVFQSRNSQWTLSSIFFLYIHSSRWLRSVRSTMHPAVQIDQSILQPGLILLPSNAVYSGCGFSLQRVKAFPQQIGCQVASSPCFPLLLSARPPALGTRVSRSV